MDEKDWKELFLYRHPRSIVSGIETGMTARERSEYNKKTSDRIQKKEEDLLLRNLLHSTACQFTSEEWEKIQAEAPWIKITDEGVEVSQGWNDLIRNINTSDNLTYEEK